MRARATPWCRHDHHHHHHRRREPRGWWLVATVSALTTFARATHAATWPVRKNIDTNVVEVENLDGGAMTVKSSGTTTITADAVVFEGDARPERAGGARDGASKRLASLESRLATLRAALVGKETALDGSLATCQAGKAALLSDLDALEAAAASPRFTPPTCTGANARNLVYVYDSALGYNVWKCVCKNDYTGTNCEIAPCDTSGFTTSGTCAVANTLAVGARCDLLCASGTVQDTPLTCTLSGGVHVLNSPVCKACDACTNCDGPGKTGFDYTEYRGVNCGSPPCALSLATGAGYTLRADGACALDANGKVPVGTKCDIECADNYIQDRQLECDWDGTKNLFNAPACVSCTAGGFTNHTGARCATAPCTVGGQNDGSCGTKLAAGSSCVQYCTTAREFITRATTCSAPTASGAAASISQTGTCAKMDASVSGTLGSFEWSRSKFDTQINGVYQFNIETAAYQGSYSKGSYKFYFRALNLKVSVSGIYHVSWDNRISTLNLDYFMLIYSGSFDANDPTKNLAFGNDDAYINPPAATTDGKWFDGRHYYDNAHAPAAFVNLDKDTQYVLVFTTYRFNYAIPANVYVTCGLFDFDGGAATVYGYLNDDDLAKNPDFTRGQCTLTAWS